MANFKDYMKRSRGYFGEMAKSSSSISDIEKRLQEIAASQPKRTGLASGKYPELRAIRKSQIELQGGKRYLPFPEESVSTAGASYRTPSREIFASEEMFSGPRYAEGLRHEKWHDVQYVGKQLNRPISTPIERTTWGGFGVTEADILRPQSKGMTLLEIANAQKATEAAASGWRGGLGQFAMEGQAYVVGKKSIPAGIGQFIRSSPYYVDNPRYAAGRPLFKTLATVNKASEAGRNLIPAARTLGAALGEEAAIAGGMALRGVGRLAGPIGAIATGYDLATTVPAMWRDWADQPTYIADPNAAEKIASQSLSEYRTGPRSSRGTYQPPINYYQPSFYR